MFRFRLQRLLELRQQAEQAKARVLVSARDAADTARRERDALADLHTTSKAEVAAAHHDEPRVGHLLQLGLVVESLNERLDHAGANVHAADAVVLSAQQLLEAAARDRRVLDRLKERHTEQWRIDAANKDRVAMDEVALSRFARNTKTSTSPNDGSAS